MGIIYGKNPVLEAINSGTTINKIYAQTSNKEIDSVIKEALKRKIIVVNTDKQKLDKMIAGYQVFIASAGGKDKEPAQAKKIEKWLTSEKGLGLEKEQAEKLMDFYGKKGKVASWHPKARQEAQNREAQEAARTQRQSDKATKRILDSKANVND